MRNSVAQSFDDWQAHVLTNRLAARAKDEDEFLERAARARRVKAPPALSLPGKSAHSDQPGRGAAPRSGDDARRGVASGSQAAVVKIASFAGGAVRIRSLLDYQSRDSEIPFERESGAIVSGERAFDELAEKWIDHNKTTSGREQEPSKDVLYFTVAAPGVVDSARAQEALAGALAGHKYAFRVEEGLDQNLVHVVTSAASSAKEERNRAMRLFDNKKSINGLKSRLATGFEGPVDLQVKRWAHGVDGAGAMLCRITRDGEVLAQLSNGKTLESREANWSAANAWKKSLRSRETRDVAHVILSAKPGTDRAAFVEAARNMLGKEFAGHEYVFALHEDRKHLHVHAAVRMVNNQGQRMDPKIPDLQRWRETMAQEARLQQIPMEATSRFEKARAPAYKLSDVRMMDRGVAPESVRRRVEDVKTNAVYVPVRAEGFTRAAASAAGWQAFAVSEPGNDSVIKMRDRTHAAAMGRSQKAPARVAGGNTPVFESDAFIGARVPADRTRASATGGAPVDVTTSKAAAQKYQEALVVARKMVAGDSNKDELEKLGVALRDRQDRIDKLLNYRMLLADAERQGVKLDNGRSFDGERKLIEPKLVAARKQFDQTNSKLKEIEMANIEQMQKGAAASQEAVLSLALLANAEQRAQLEAAAKELAVEDAKRIAAAEQRNIERQKAAQDLGARIDARDGQRNTGATSPEAFAAPKADAEKIAPKQTREESAEIRGATFQQPEPQSSLKFIHERVKIENVEEIHYSQVAADGSKGAIAFIDKGQSLVIKDEKNTEAVAEALKLAHARWGSVTLAGSETFKSEALRLAAEQGLEITNPELEQRFAEEKARAAEARSGQRPAPSQAGGGQAGSADVAAATSGPSAPSVASTPSERGVRKELNQEKIVAEAKREERQADTAAARGERGPAQSTPGAPYVSPAEANAAREAARANSDSPDQRIPDNAAESEAIKQARIEQDRLLAQQAADQRAQDAIAEFRKKEAERRNQKPNGGQKM